jgi:hypothetical protein
MSAYLCNDDVFDYLAAAYDRMRQRLGVYAQPTHADYHEAKAAGLLPRYTGGHITSYEAAEVLRFQNVRSVRAKYRDADEAMGTTRPYRPRYSVSADEVMPLQVLTILSCVEYQSCETDDYRETLAYLIAQRLRSAAIHMLIDSEERRQGTLLQVWGWSRDEHATRIAAKKAAIAATVQGVH